MTISYVCVYLLLSVMNGHPTFPVIEFLYKYFIIDIFIIIILTLFGRYFIPSQIALTHPSYTSNHGDRPRPLLSTFDRCGASAIDSEPRPPRGTKRPRGLEGLSAAINNPVVEGEEDKEWVHATPSCEYR